MNKTSRKLIQDLVISDILRERLMQDEKWGKDRSIDIQTVPRVLGEEFGEVCRALNEKDMDNFKVELIQVAAFSLATLESIYRDDYAKIDPKELD